MKYNGMEVHEADGEDYKHGMTPKKMLVWDCEDGILLEREVIGYINGRWVAVDISNDAGACNWNHAAEIPKKPTLADYVQKLHRITGRFPYVVHQKGMQITDEESRDAISVPEEQALLYIHNLVELSNTFVVLPGCSKMVKEMFRTLKEDNRNYAPHADVVFFGDEEAE